MAKRFQKTTTRLEVKIVKISTNEIIFTIPTDSMEAYQYFSNDFVDQVMKSTFGAKVDLIGDIKIIIDQEFKYK